ncbi:MAG: hypothetical protein HY904_24990 [Deltaproteobacteria bacterium]|nr:hypothetical protein [Deltaproteobacteria bacterium]
MNAERDPQLESLFAPPAHVDDAGFTDRVLARLPARRAVNPWWRRAILAGAGAAAAAVGLGAPTVLAAVQGVFTTAVTQVASGGVPVVSLVMAGLLAWSAAAVVLEERA